MPKPTKCSSQPQWPQPTAQSVQSIGYHGGYAAKRETQPPKGGAIKPVSFFYAPNELEHTRTLGNIAYINGQHWILLARRTRKFIFGHFCQQHLWFFWTSTFHFESTLRTAASTTIKEITEIGNVFFSEEGLSQHTCGQPPPVQKTPECSNWTQILVILYKLKTFYIIRIYSYFSYTQIRVEYVSRAIENFFSGTYFIRNTLLNWSKLGGKQTRVQRVLPTWKVQFVN